MVLWFLFVFFVVLILVNRNNFGAKSFEKYATARGQFGVLPMSMTIFSVWYPGSMFTVFVGMSVASGFLGVYVVLYSIICMFVLYLLAEKTMVWGKRYKLKTQADILGLRYNSRNVRLTTGLIGLILCSPWLLFEWVTQGLVISYATGGKISPFLGMLIGIVIVLSYVLLGGMESVVTSNFFQGVFMFFGGVFLAFWLIYKFFGSFDGAIDTMVVNFPETLTLQLPTAYWLSIIITSGLGALMWPWSLPRLFASSSLRATKQTVLIVPLMGVLFWAAIQFISNFLHYFEEARSNPEEALLWAASQVGSFELALLSTIIMAASVGSVSAQIQAMANSVSRDVAQVIKKDISEKLSVRIAQTSVVIIAAICLILATFDLGALIQVALLAYQGIIMFFPVVLLGYFWKRANKEGAIIGLIAGIIVSMSLAFFNPPFILIYGWTPGMYGLLITTLIMVIAGFAKPVDQHVQSLWDDINNARNSSKGKKSVGDGQEVV